MAIVKFTNSKGSSGALLNYITQREKTEEKLISGKDCVAESAAAEFRNVKLMYGKTDGRQYVHIVQSFSPNDKLDHKTAHEIGCKFAEYFKDFQTVIATHKDREHVHNHLMLNTVNFETGKKFHQIKAEMQLVKDYSNRLCRDYGLTECPVKSQKKDYKLGEYYAAEKGRSWKFKLMATIDEAMRYSRTKAEFIKNMNKSGYQVLWTDNRKYITYTAPEGQKSRDNRLHDERYLKQNMEAHYEKYGAVEKLAQSGRFDDKVYNGNEFIRDTAGISGNAVANADSYGERVSGGSGVNTVTAGRGLRQNSRRIDQDEEQNNRNSYGIRRKDFEEYSQSGNQNYEHERFDEYDDEHGGERGFEYEQQNYSDGQTLDSHILWSTNELVYLAKTVENMVNSSDYEQDEETSQQEQQNRNQKHEKSRDWEMEM